VELQTVKDREGPWASIPLPEFPRQHLSEVIFLLERAKYYKYNDPIGNDERVLDELTQLVRWTDSEGKKLWGNEACDH
jgi:hypothetical protein